MRKLLALFVLTSSVALSQYPLRSRVAYHDTLRSFNPSSSVAVNDSILLSGLLNKLKINADDSLNIFLGTGPTTTTGFQNTTIGFQNFTLNTTGYENLAIGNHSLKNNTTGVDNTAVGYSALEKNTTANYNTGFGTETLQFTTTGTSNTAVGFEAINTNVTGSSNVGIGYQSIFSNVSGVQNTALGTNALYSVTGNHNTGVGRDVLYSATGARKIGLGAWAGYNNTTLSDRLFINSTHFPNIGDDTTKSIIYGMMDSTSRVNQRLYINANAFVEGDSLVVRKFLDLPYVSGTATVGAGDSIRVTITGVSTTGFTAQATYKTTAASVVDTAATYNLNAANTLSLYGKFGWVISYVVFKQ